MAKISLRAYLREINTLIESKKIDLAFEHCKHILKSYPKYIDIYRLLGKAYLESSRYEEAEGMFRRVLAVLPDDFVSHLGLSVVKEENNDLDTAIWHMERAYELKSTQTIHEELHRLFTQRDGVAPPKPLITRGALIRINVRSGLYQQALKEIDLALKEDTQRIDLEILRAQIYYKLNNIPNTLKYCQQVIKKRPYAYDINTILAEIAATPDQAEPFKQRLYELDPYTSFVTESTSLSDVQDDLIMIEKLDLLPTIETEQADEILDVDETISQEGYAETQEVSALDDSEDSFEDSTLLEAQSHESAHIPDWMKEAGWEAGTPKPAEEEQALIEQYDQASDLPDLEMDNAIDELEEEDLPEWIKDFAPAEAVRDELPSLFSEEGDQEEEKIAWLDAILSGEEGQQPVSTPEQPEKMDEALEPKGMPVFGEDLAADQEWLENISTQEGLMADQKQSEDRPSRMPAPEEMNQFVFEDDEEDLETSAEPAANDEPLEAYAEETDEDDIDSAIAWLEGLAAKQGADEEVLFSAPETRDEQPEWIFGDEEQPETEESEEFAQETQPAESSMEFEMDDETIPSIEIPDQEPLTIDEAEEAPEEIITEESVGFAAETEEEEFEFAFEYDQEIGSPEALADAIETDGESQDVPEWLKAIAPPEKVTKPLPVEVPLEQIPAEVEDEPAEMLEEVSLEEELEEETEWDHLLTEEEEEQQAASVPDAERLATTAVLDFIKQQADNDVSEIDEWLKNLPDLPEDMPALEEELEEDIPVTDEETGTILSTMKQERDQGPVDFIDDFFSEAIDEEEPELAASGDEPYQWEQIYEEDDLPDWISDISEDDLGESIASLDSSQERDTEFPDMPAWITGEDDSEYDEILPETQESEPMASLVELEEETLDVIEEEIEAEPIDETDESISVIEEAPEFDELEIEEGALPAEEEKQREIDFEELFILAKNQLHNGEFDEAHPQLEQLMQDDQWTQDVIDVLLFDIENYHPIEIHSWMLLGDAYRKQNNLQQALDAYTKAEGFIK
jgi:tetratricopeptide (TPR) repeat protein